MRDSPWFFPVIATIHLLGLSMIGGAVLLVDLRLLGLGLRYQPVALLARDAERWLLRGLSWPCRRAFSSSCALPRSITTSRFSG